MYLKYPQIPFDLIFADPPYEMENIQVIPDLIFNQKMLKPGGWLGMEFGAGQDSALKLIAENAGCEGAVIVERVKNDKDNFGFNAATEKFEDLVKAGVIDPAKVARTALQNAASIASLMLTTEAMISEIPEKNSAPAMPPGGGGMGDY